MVERDVTSRVKRVAGGMPDPPRIIGPTAGQEAARYIKRTILIVGGSPRLRATLGTLTGLLPGNFFAAVPAAIPTEQRGSGEILKAIRRGDAQGAFEACRAMMRAHGVHALRYLEERGLFREGGTTNVPRGRNEIISR
jgi:hypothetical protein